MPKILIRTMSVKECSMKSGWRGSSSTAANCLVKPMRWSNCRSGSSPASEVSGASETSIWMGKGLKKSNANGPAGCRFKANPRGFEYNEAKSLDEDRGHYCQRRGGGDLVIRTYLAARWQIEAASLHHEYAKARQEFNAALVVVVAFHHP